MRRVYPVPSGAEEYIQKILFRRGCRWNGRRGFRTDRMNAIVENGWKLTYYPVGYDYRKYITDDDEVIHLLDFNRYYEAT